MNRTAGRKGGSGPFSGSRKVLWEVTSKLAVKDEQDLARQNFMLSQKIVGTTVLENGCYET